MLVVLRTDDPLTTTYCGPRAYTRSLLQLLEKRRWTPLDALKSVHTQFIFTLPSNIPENTVEHKHQKTPCEKPVDVLDNLIGVSPSSTNSTITTRFLSFYLFLSHLLSNFIRLLFHLLLFAFLSATAAYTATADYFTARCQALSPRWFPCI